MKARKINLDRAPISSDKIESKQDFGHVVTNYKLIKPLGQFQTIQFNHHTLAFPIRMKLIMKYVLINKYNEILSNRIC